MAAQRPTTGLPPSVQLGSTGPRLVAALVEVGPVWLLCGLAVLLAFLLDSGVLLAILCLVLALGWGILVWAQRTTKAAGPGMRLDSLQIVGFRDGRPLSWGRVLLRWLVFAGLAITVVGLIALAVAMARHPRRQGWHDLAADAVVIKERPLAPPRPKPAVARATGPAPANRPAAKTSAPGRAPAASKAAAAKKGAPTKKAAPAKKVAPGKKGAPAKKTTAPSKPATVSAEGGERSAAGGVTTASADEATAPISVTAPDVAATGEAAGPPAPPTGASAENGQRSATEPAGPEEPAVSQEPEPIRAEWWLRLDDGRDVGVEGLVLLGRNPQPRVGEEDATLIKVLDETRTVSKSHLAVGVDAGGLYVMDRGSTNGTMVTAPDGGQRPCPPGDLIDVPGGSVISFGDHWFEVRRDAE